MTKDKRISSIYKKAPAIILLLFLFCLIANTCPVRSLLIGVSVQTAQTEKSTSLAHVAQTSTCSPSKVAKALVVKQPLLKKYSSPYLPVIFYLAGIYLLLSARHSVTTAHVNKRSPILAEDIPLFLRNRSIII